MSLRRRQRRDDRAPQEEQQVAAPPPAPARVLTCWRCLKPHHEETWPSSGPDTCICVYPVPYGRAPIDNEERWRAIAGHIISTVHAELRAELHRKDGEPNHVTERSSGERGLAPASEGVGA